MKRTFAILSVTAILLTVTPMVAFACGRGCGGGQNANANYYSICAVEGCTQDVQHYHDGIAYAPHYYNDGHGYCGSQYGGGYCY